MTPSIEQHHGQPCVHLQLPGGDRALIALFGAQVLSWRAADGIERLYLSPRAVFDGKHPIRGGVPICFPQFNQRVLQGRSLPKHGFARTLGWSSPGVEGDATSTTAVLALSDAGLPDALRTIWPFRFAAHLEITLTAGCLKIGCTVQNRDTVAWPFALALHSYFRVDDIAHTRLGGLQGVTFWDAVNEPGATSASRAQIEEPLAIVGETDRVYQNAPVTVDLQQPRSRLRIQQGANFTETVIWNPGDDLCARLADMPADGYRHMLCIEGAKIDTPVMLAPGESWQGTQQMIVA